MDRALHSPTTLKWALFVVLWIALFTCSMPSKGTKIVYNDAINYKFCKGKLLLLLL